MQSTLDTVQDASSIFETVQDVNQIVSSITDAVEEQSEMMHK